MTDTYGPAHGCPSCNCENTRGQHLTIYAPNELLWGRCGECGQIRWFTERYPPRYDGGPLKATHCACCTHPHDLGPGGHTIKRRPRIVDRAAEGVKP